MNLKAFAGNGDFRVSFAPENTFIIDDWQGQSFTIERGELTSLIQVLTIADEVVTGVQS